EAEGEGRLSVIKADLICYAVYPLKVGSLSSPAAYVDWPPAGPSGIPAAKRTGCGCLRIESVKTINPAKQHQAVFRLQIGIRFKFQSL
ncbi:hypothetical protein, partial [Chitinophaga pinensis]|uniref:hypothetical protein n=1 Tax=Chitinophaga pinensis TaxID=79329 RepID=UPI001C99E4AA